MLRSSRKSLEMKPVACQQCNQEFMPTDRAYRKRQAKFCSDRCKYLAMRKARNCKNCGKEIQHGHNSRYCSPQCSREHIQFRRANRTFKVVNCSVCGVEFRHQPSVRSGKFCSRKCYSVEQKRKRMIETCANCKQDFNPRNRRIGKLKFCSQKCTFEYWKTYPHPRYLGNRSADRGKDWKVVAPAIRQRDNHQCVACGEEPRTKALPVDHIVPFRTAKRIAAKTPGLNPNDERNLATLCQVCHSWKLQAERALHCGDVMQFYVDAVQVIRSHERVKVAMELFGLWSEVERRLNELGSKPVKEYPA